MLDAYWSPELAKLRHVRYGGFSFIALCPVCGKPVEADKMIAFHMDGEGNYDGGRTNAACSEHGRVEMKYDGQIVK